MNLTVYCGTFNPIHIGHLIIAEYVRNLLNCDKFLFIPSNIPPHRKDCIISSEHRLEMVRLSLESNSFFEVSDIELKLRGFSYSYNTIIELYNIYDVNNKINFLIGTDAFKYIDKWYKADKLSELVKFIIVRRKGDEDINRVMKNINLKSLDYEVIETPLIEVSSSFIRDRIKNNESIKYLTQENVENYIKNNNLYGIK